MWDREISIVGLNTEQERQRMIEKDVYRKIYIGKMYLERHLERLNSRETNEEKMHHKLHQNK